MVAKDKRPAPLQYIEAMKPLAVSSVPAGEWHFENKFDGFRALALVEDGSVELWSRNRKTLSARHPEIAEALKTLPCKTAAIDGEIVALDAEGRPSFQTLQNLNTSDVRAPLLYYVFDLLNLNGEALTYQPIEKRRKLLEKLIPKDSLIKVSPFLRGTAELLLTEIRKHGLEGIIAKARGSKYEPGRRSGTWLKCRVAHEQEFVIGGYTLPKGSRTNFGSIVIGYYDKGHLLYTGKVGSGFNHKLLRSLSKSFETLVIEKCPFANLPQLSKPRFGQGMTKSAMQDITWLKPKLVCQIRFSEWTREGSLRHPVFLGLRDDKNAADVIRESLAGE